MKNDPWDYTNGKPVTKVIIPVKYYKNSKLKLSAGHHHVIGERVIIENIENIRLAHYRLVSYNHFKYKSLGFSIRDIATMSINTETAQRTNQVASIENCKSDIEAMSIKESYLGYKSDIVYSPVDCTLLKNIEIRYDSLSDEKIEERMCDIGKEMAIREYNLKISKSKRSRIVTIAIWIDDIDKLTVDLINKIITNKKLIVCIVTSIDIGVRKINLLGIQTMVTPIKYLKFFDYQYLYICAKDSSACNKEIMKNNIDMNKVIYHYL